MGKSIRVPGVKEPVVLREYYCEVQYPNGPPDQSRMTDAERDAAARA